MRARIGSYRVLRGATAILAAIAPLAAVRSWPSGDSPEPGSGSASGACGEPTAGVRRCALPLAFVENQGQWDGPARFVAHRSGLAAWLLDDGFAVRFERSRDEEGASGVVVRFIFEGALPHPKLEGQDPQVGIHSYFLGNDPRRWRSGLPGYHSVLYRGLYPSVDLRLREESQRLEYDLILGPEARLEEVTLRCEGADGFGIDPDGSLVLQTPLGSVRQAAPCAWTEGPGGERRQVESRYVRIDGKRFGFETDPPPAGETLVIDPGLEWSTLLGGPGVEYLHALALDPAGAPVVLGSTTSSAFPTTTGAYDTVYGGGGSYGDAFVTRLNATGTALVFSTYLGGSLNEDPWAIRIDSSGNLAVGGATASPNFPTTAGALDINYSGSTTGPLPLLGDGFVARLNPTGTALLFGTFLGGTGFEYVFGLDVDPGGAITAGGITSSSDFPTTPSAYDTTHNGGPPTYATDGFVARLQPSGSGLSFSTFLGGSGADEVGEVLRDASGGTVAAGWTGSPNFPLSPGAYDTSPGGVGDAFVCRIDPTGGTILASTFLGGTSGEASYGMVLAGAGDPVLVGYTVSTDFPTTPGAFDPIPSGDEGYVTRLDSGLTALVFSSFLGGSGGDWAYGVGLDSAQRVAVVGVSYSTDFPTTPGAFATTLGGTSSNAFVLRSDSDGGTLVYSTLLSGTTGAFGEALALDATGAATVGGWTTSTGFPVTSGAFDTSFNGQNDAFVARLDMLPAGASKYGVSSPGCQGMLAIGVTSMPEVGNAGFAITCTAAPPNVAGGLGIATAPASPPIPIAGILVALDPLFAQFASAFSNPLGYAEAALPIPPIPGLVGLQVYAQFFWLDPCAPAGVSASNALAIVVQP